MTQIPQNQQIIPIENENKNINEQQKQKNRNDTNMKNNTSKNGK